jgi:dolichyl-diphosphooligosaccharide--protein glycosyltransferase
MNRTRIEITACAVILTLIFLVSLSMRIGIPWSHVFVGPWVKFTDNDAYFYVRLLDNLSHHFPSLGSFDPYYIYPAGKDLANQSLFMVYFMGFFAWLFGGGSPSQHTIDLIGAYFPAVLGALLVFPVFFIGRAVFNKWAGLIAAVFTALMPGEFLIRTLLGYTDTHALEIFFSTLFMAFIVLSIKAGKLISFPPSRTGGLRQHITPLIFAVAAGISLGLYLLTWAGALLFVFISFVWLVVQVVIDHARGKPTLYLLVTCFTAYLIALLFSLSSPASTVARIPLMIAIIASLVLPAVSIFMQRRGFKPAFFFVFIASAAVAALLILLVIGPQFLGSMFRTLTGFFGWNTGTGIAEDQPLLIQQGSFTLALLWGNYTSASLLALVAFVFMAYKAFRKGEPEMVALLIWSFITLLAALAMRRFAYYLAINMSLLAGYCGWLILGLFGVKGAAPETNNATTAGKVPPRIQGKGKKSAAAMEKRLTTRNRALAAIGIAVVALLAIYPNTGPLPGGDRPFFDVATRGLDAPGDAWCESLDWLRNNTPEPFGDANYYYAYTAAPGNTPGYSVVCWWDFGYWISQIAHRVPLSNPGSAAMGEQNFFTAQDSTAAENISSQWEMKYVIVDDYTINWNKGFSAIADAAGQSESRYYEIYYRQQNNKMTPTLLYYPDYYNSMAVRLYCFEGHKYTPQETAVISWEERQDSNGQPYKEITGLKTFHCYSEASGYISSQQGGNWRIVGKDPTVSPVPLDGLDGYHLAYSSSQKSKVGTSDTSSVKIFEYSQDYLPHE